MSDPAEWLDDYWQRCQYDDDLLEEANLTITMLHSSEGESLV